MSGRAIRLVMVMRTRPVLMVAVPLRLLAGAVLVLQVALRRLAEPSLATCRAEPIGAAAVLNLMRAVRRHGHAAHRVNAGHAQNSSTTGGNPGRLRTAVVSYPREGGVYRPASRSRACRAWRLTTETMKRNNSRVLTIVIVTALTASAVLAVIGLLAQQNRPPDRADASDPQLVARGAVVYQQNCMACHGANLEGQPNWRRMNADGTLPAPPHDASGHTWHHSDQVLFDVTKWGSAAVAGSNFKSAMPVYAEVLDDADIWAVLAYIKSRWPPEIQDAQRARSGDTRR